MVSFSHISPELELHLLRHFDTVPETYLKELSLCSGKNIAELEQQLAMPGSKFNVAFADSPPELCQRLKAMDQESWQIAANSPDKTDYVVTFSTSDWPEGIGHDHIIESASLAEWQLKQITIQSIRGFLVKTLNTKNFPATNQLVIVAGKDQMPVTIFPGKWLPALTEQVIKDHIFLVKS